MDKEDEEKTAFITNQGIFFYSKMPFGLKNAEATYQRLVDKAFQKQIGRNLEVYMDDLVIKSRTEHEIMRDIEETFKTLREINMKLNPKKCTFRIEEDMLLGYKVKTKGIKKSDFQWTAEAKVAFKEIKKLIAELPTLIAPMEKRSANCVPYGCARSLERSKDKSLVTTMDVEEEPRNYGHSSWTGMVQYPEKVKTLARSFKKFSIKQVPRNGNKKADALRKIASTSFAHLTKQVLIEELKEKSIHEAEVLTVVEEEGSTWMTPFYEYLTKETLLVEKEKERAIRWKSGRYAVYHPVPRNPQQKLTPIMSPWPFYKWGIDIARPFPEGPGNVKFLIVAIDYFTKWIEAKPVATLIGKAKGSKTRLNFEGCSRRNMKAQKVSQHSESRTPIVRGEHQSVQKSKRSRRVYGIPKRTSVFSRIRCDRSESPRHRPRGKGRRDVGVFNRLGDKGNSKRSSIEDDDLSKPWVFEEIDPFASRIRYFDLLKNTQMPNNVKTYDGSDDPEDHLKIFQAAVKVERWETPTWCHMFNSTLIGSTRVKMDDPNITMEEYIMLEEEKARMCGKVHNWETTTYGNIWYDEDIHDLRSVETEFPTIVFNETLMSEPMVSSLNNEIDFRISFDKFDDEDYTVIYDKNSFSYKIISVDDLKTDLENDNDKVNMPSFPSPDPTVSYFDDLDYF
nr:reverse transcriptase domain-containing protein [Tanacetum cinerariifolium]